MKQKEIKSIRKLAIKSELPYSNVYDIVNSRKLPRLDELEKLAKALEVDISDLQ